MPPEEALQPRPCLLPHILRAAFPKEMPLRKLRMGKETERDPTTAQAQQKRGEAGRRTPSSTCGGIR